MIYSKLPYLLSRLRTKEGEICSVSLDLAAMIKEEPAGKIVKLCPVFVFLFQHLTVPKKCQLKSDWHWQHINLPWQDKNFTECDKLKTLTQLHNVVKSTFLLKYLLLKVKTHCNISSYAICMSPHTRITPFLHLFSPQFLFILDYCRSSPSIWVCLFILASTQLFKGQVQ